MAFSRTSLISGTSRSCVGSAVRTARFSYTEEIALHNHAQKQRHHNRAEGLDRKVEVLVEHPPTVLPKELFAHRIGVRRYIGSATRGSSTPKSGSIYRI